MIVIHAGMHKTGSSSIQRSLITLDEAKLTYLSINSPNHSGLFNVLFGDNPEQVHGFSRRGLTHEDILKHRGEWYEKLDHLLRHHMSETPERPAVLSAEAISAAPEHVVQRLADYMRQYDTNIRVIAYVRPPASFISSAFQQRQKTGFPNVSLKDLKLWPRYRHRFEKLDKIFGRENVTLKLFQRDHMLQGDVVLDFANEIGISMTPDEVVRSNESLSLEAVALMYTHTQFRTSELKKDPASSQRQAAYVRNMATIGSRKFVLGKAITHPVIKRHRADLDWMEERLGMPIGNTSLDDAQAINSEEDLFAAAVDALPLLEQPMLESAGHEAPTEIVARSVARFQEAMPLSKRQ